MHRPKTEKEFNDVVAKSDGPVVVGFFGDFSEASRKAEPEFEEFCRENKEMPAVLVDLGWLKGLHKRFGVDSVPTVLLLGKDKVVQKIVGPHTKDYYSRALSGSWSGSRSRRTGGSRADDSKPRHDVVLYVGASCPWCARARSYLRRHRVPFREVDVSRDQSKARELVSRSGHQGVPQLNIDGHWVIGFDVAKINRLLGLQAHEA